MSVDNDVLIGEGFVGNGPNAAHVNTVFGLRSGPVGVAWATALATPRQGHVPFVAVAKPNVPIVPFTLFVNKSEIISDVHGRLTWGAAQAGVAAGVAVAHDDGTLPNQCGDYVLIVAVWVDPRATDEEEVFANNRDAVASALAMAFAGGPSLEDALIAMVSPTNPYFGK